MMNKLSSDLFKLCGQLIVGKSMLRLEYNETGLTYSTPEASLIICEIPWKKVFKEP